MTVRMSIILEDQFISKYLPRIVPWALNYDCGGAECPDLFANGEEMCENQNLFLTEGSKQRWRKIAGEAILTPREHAKMLALRSEMQVAGDWIAVP
eukprot:7457109-Karenia_brevis.AAC.1